ncbi:MAG TPA: hypothetical protein PKA58_19215, partial [Polyangium sp.]|nr:hypothetical protein [Polyangium sp.]
RAKKQPRDSVELLLERIVATPGGFKYLRATLTDVSTAYHGRDLTPREVVREVSACIAAGRLSFVFLRNQDALTLRLIKEGDAAR